MIKHFINFLCISCMLIGTHTAIAKALYEEGVAVLLPIIEKELAAAKVELNSNKASKAAAITDLQSKMDNIWNDLKLHGYSEKTGIDSEWRGAFVSLQGIIEKSVAVALKEKKIQSAEGFIITPRMPTPLMLARGKSFKSLNLENPSDFAELRRMILEEYLSAGARLNAVYCYNAATALSNPNGVEIYKNTLKTFSANLKDQPVIKSDMANFPADKTGAIYYLNNNSEQVIAIQSYQLSQLDKTATSQNKWAIRFGSHAKSRAEEINVFLEKNGAEALVRR